MEYETLFGVKVDKRIPERVKTRLCEQWENWKKGSNKDFLVSTNANLLTRYEHFLIGSGVGLPPDPFKPLCLQHDGADLEAVIATRRKQHPPGAEKRHPYYPCMTEEFENLTGIKKYESILSIEQPDINIAGRIPSPKILAVYTAQNTKLDLAKEIINSMRWITFYEHVLWEGVIVREVFDFENGYEIELVRID